MPDDPFKFQHDIHRFPHGSKIDRNDDLWVADDLLVGTQAAGWLRRGINNICFKIFALLLLLIFVLLTGRLAYVQLIYGSRYRALAEGNRIRTVVIPAPRGLIKDSFNNPLVQNEPSFALYVISAQLPADKQERQTVIDSVSRLLPLDVQENFMKAVNSQSYVPELIMEGLTHETAMSLLVQQPQLPGIEVIAEASRKYQDGLSLGSVLGYVRKISEEELNQNKSSGYRFTDRIGKAGLEKSYEDDLRGINGEENFEVDAHGHYISMVGRHDPVVGKTLQLYLDAGLQQQLTASLQHWAGSHPASAVALDPDTGGVLAMVSLPTFDANIFSGSISTDVMNKIYSDLGRPLINRSISGLYPSGSTIKPMLSAAALETGVITPQTTVNSTGGISVGKWFFPDWKAGGHGITNVVKALAESINSFFYAVGGGWGDIKGLGPDRIATWLKKFGWGRALGIDLPGESDGTVPDPAWKAARSTEPWYIGDTYHESIGQGDILVTPLQVAAATAAVANGGTLYQPQMVKTVIANDKTTQPHDPRVLADHIVSASSIQTVKDGMRACVTSGSARRLSTLPIEVAGKTGTAQVPKGDPHAWFTAFAPFDHPKIVLAIVIENGGEGSSVATPVAEEVLRWWAQNRLPVSQQH